MYLRGGWERGRRDLAVGGEIGNDNSACVREGGREGGRVNEF
jgi:hypothetical protein